MGIWGTVSAMKGAATRLAGCAIAALILAAAAPAGAETMTGDGGRLDLEVTGRITPSCRLAGGGEMDFGELTGGQEIQADFGLACNVPFDISFQSQSGGLAHASKPRGEGPFAGLLGYTLNVTIPTLSPHAATLGGTFASQNLTAKKTLSSGDGIAQGGGRIQIRTDRPEGAGLLAGEYSEVLSITVAPRV